MTAVFHYLIQVIICSGILYGYYHITLRNKRFHRYNRYYLLGASVLSVLLPLFAVPLYFSATQTDHSPVLATLTRLYAAVVIVKSKTNTSNWLSFFTWQNVLGVLYMLVVAVLLFLFIKAIRNVWRLTKKYDAISIDNIRFYSTTEPATPYSFFNHLFWNNKINAASPVGQQIFRHEAYHIKQKHSIDILFTELIFALCWINPFFFLIRKEIKTIHEFLADEYAVQQQDETVYAELLLQQLLQTSVTNIVNPFFHTQIKRRIAMIIQPQKTTHQYLRKLLVLPLAALAVLLFAFTYQKQKQNFVTNQSNVSTPSKHQTKNDTTITITLVEKGKTAPTPAVQQADAGAEQHYTINLVEIKQDTPPRPEAIFEKAEINPSFPGGQKEWGLFLQKNLNVQLPADKGAKPGSYTTYIKCIVNKDGTISELKPLTNHGFGMEEEVMRIMKLSPKWEPAMQNGHKVNAYLTLPVTFVISNEAVADPLSNIPEISKEELLNMDMCKMAGVADGTLLNAVFTIDKNDDNIESVTTKNCLVPARITQLIKMATPGRLITIDNINVNSGAGINGRMPSKVYKIK